MVCLFYSFVQLTNNCFPVFPCAVIILFFHMSSVSVLQAAADSLVNELEEYITESFVSQLLLQNH